MSVMKRIILILAVIAASLSCSRYEEVDSLPLKRQQVVLGVDDATRAYFESLGRAYRHYWELGDKLSVFYRTNVNSEFTLADGANTQRGVFEGEAASGLGESIYVVYPYSTQNSLADGVLSVNYPALQSLRADKSSYDRQGLVMVACGVDGEMKMSNASSFVHLSLTGSNSISKVELKAIGGEALVGAASVRFEGVEPVVAMVSEQSVVTVECNAQLSDKATELFVAVAPVELSAGFEVVVYDAEGQTMTRRHSSALKLERNTVYRMPALEYQSDKVVEPEIVADLMDVVFKEDGTAEDISPMKLPVTTLSSSALTTYYDEIQGQQVARFGHAIGSDVTSGYYSVSYANSAAFKSAIADGFTMECLFTMGASVPGDKELKYFSGLQRAGFGLMVDIEDKGGAISFVPRFDVNGTPNYYFVNSGVVPSVGQYYHAVGVWDKSAGQLYIYVDGKLCGTMDAKGAELVINESEIYQTVCVGADTAKNKGESAWNGDVLIARIYDDALTAEQIESLYNKSKRDRSKVDISRVRFAEKVTVSAGYKYTIYADGFKSGDKIILTGQTKEYVCDVKNYLDCAVLTIPDQFVSGSYTLVLNRGVMRKELGVAEFTMDSMPKADMLDVVFNADGTASDVSAMMMGVDLYASDRLMTYYDSYQNSYAAYFSNVLYSDISSGFYAVNFAAHSLFKELLADGHTLETLVQFDAEHTVSDEEVKWFSCHDSGGTGFMLSKQNKGHDITFLPRVGSKYYYASSKKVAEVGKTYHVVGVWDKSQNKASIYVDGQLCGTVTTSGAFVQPNNETACWFCIGADARNVTPIGGQNAMNGSVGMARVYDKALTASEVVQLWNAARRDRPVVNIPLSDLQYFTRAEVTTGSRYSVYASGLQSGDVLRLESVESASDVYQLDSSVEQDRLVAQIPAQLESGVYNMSLQRGEERRMIGRVEFVVKQNPREYAAPKIVAHRGVCNNGEADNSMESFVSAQNIGGIYGTEFDIFTTSDGVIVLNHDKTINGYTIENSTYEQIKNQTLSNGEKIPTLEALLDQAKSTPNLRLVVEVKTHLDINNTISCTEKAIELIKAKGMENCVDFISFNYQACATAARLLPNITVGFLAEAANPTLQQMHADGINNADCKWSTFLKNNLYYVDEAHALGMTVNTWTVNDAASMFDIYQLGIDFLTTDQCALAKSIYSKRFVEHP